MSSSASGRSDERGRLIVPVELFRNGDFPRVCAATGEPAETWRTFTFGALPVWAYALLLIPHVGHAAFGAFERRARGRLPLTKASARRIDRAGWPGVLLVAVAFAQWAGIAVIGILVGPHAFDARESTAAGILFAGALVTLAAGVGFLLSGVRSSGPQGAVKHPLAPAGERMVEMWNLHPEFVAATIAMYKRRQPRPDFPQ